jgi:hypothetical protein
MGTKVKAVPIEAHNNIGKIERYHGPLRRSFDFIMKEVLGIFKAIALQMALKCCNDSAGPNGLVPTLLVYGSYPRLSEYDPPSPSITERSAAIKKAMDEIAKERNKRQVADAIATRNGLDTSAVHNLQINSLVLVWRDKTAPKKGSWKVPFNMTEMDGEECYIDFLRGPVKFRSTAVKPYYSKKELEEPTLSGLDELIDTEHQPSDNDEASPLLPPQFEADNVQIPVVTEPVSQPPRRRGRPKKIPAPDAPAPHLVEEPVRISHGIRRPYNRGRPDVAVNLQGIEDEIFEDILADITANTEQSKIDSDDAKAPEDKHPEVKHIGPETSILVLKRPKLLREMCSRKTSKHRGSRRSQGSCIARVLRESIKLQFPKVKECFH